MGRRDELEDINIRLRILDDMMNDMRVEEMKLRIQTYDSISQDEQRVVTHEEFYILKESELLRWRQRQIDNGYISDIEDLTLYLARDLLIFIENYPQFETDEHFRNIIRYLYSKYLTNVSRETKRKRMGHGFNNVNSYNWPIPLENNISLFIEYLDELVRALEYEGSIDGHGKYWKPKYKRKMSRRKHKHKKVKSCKKRSH